MLGVWCHPYKPADQGDHPATRFHQEKIRPPKKTSCYKARNCKSWDIYLCYFTALFVISTAWPGLSIDSMSGITIFCSQRRKNIELEAILPIEVLQDCWLYLGCIFHAFEGLQNQARIILHTTMQFDNSQITFHGSF